MCADDDSSFQTAVTYDGWTRVVHVSGELDVASRDALTEVCLACDQLSVRVEMNDLTFMDCSGYGGLVAVRNRLRAIGGSLTLRGAAGQPARLLGLIDRLEHQPSGLAAHSPALSSEVS
jgi:anti-anti-sigma factor